MEPAELAHDVGAGALREMVRVREDDRRAELVELRRRDALHAPVRRDRHERRRLDDPVGRHEAPEARARRMLAEHGERRGAGRSAGRSRDQHRIAEAVEAIALAHRRLVRGRMRSAASAATMARSGVAEVEVRQSVDEAEAVRAR
jgi:hypothetical protein